MEGMVEILSFQCVKDEKFIDYLDPSHDNHLVEVVGIIGHDGKKTRFSYTFFDCKDGRSVESWVYEFYIKESGQKNRRRIPDAIWHKMHDYLMDYDYTYFIKWREL